MVVSTGTGGSPLPLRPRREDGDGEDEEQQIPRIPDWDFSHLDRIIETVLQQKPDHNVYLYGSVESSIKYQLWFGWEKSRSQCKSIGKFFTKSIKHGGSISTRST